MSKWLGFKYSHFDLKSSLSHCGLYTDKIFIMVDPVETQTYMQEKSCVELFWRQIGRPTHLGLIASSLSIKNPNSTM